MTDRTHDEPPAVDDRTRDITLPPLPDRPAPAMPAAWAAAHPPLAPPTTAVPAPARPPVAAAGTPSAAAGAPPAEGSTPPAGAGAVEQPGPAGVEARLLAGRRTDELVRPPGAPVRERTLAFSSPEMRHRPVEPVRVGSNPRRWPWVVLFLLPVLVILASTVAWVVLVQTG